MSWNYRIFKRKRDRVTTYELYETYYDKDGNPNGWSEEPEYGDHDSADDLIEDLAFMLKDALRYRKDILDYDKEENEDNNP